MAVRYVYISPTQELNLLEWKVNELYFGNLSVIDYMDSKFIEQLWHELRALPPGKRQAYRERVLAVREALEPFDFLVEVKAIWRHLCAIHSFLYLS